MVLIKELKNYLNNKKFKLKNIYSNYIDNKIFKLYKRYA